MGDTRSQHVVVKQPTPPKNHCQLLFFLTLTLLPFSFPLSVAAQPVTCNGKGATVVGTSGGTLNGTSGDDVIVGQGAFTYTVNAGNGNDTICTGAGTDTINAGSGDDWVDAGGGNNQLLGDNGHDRLMTGAGNDTIQGGSGDDVIEAGEGTNTVSGDNGNDTIVTGAGNDTINGGSGDDTITAGNGTNTIIGDNGHDTIVTGAGTDTIDAGSGDDTVSSGDGDDNVIGDNGNDILLGGAGNDQLDGGNGNDRLEGGDGNDTLTGQNGEDTLLGGLGNDTVTAENGNDFLDGGPGTDSLNGGTGTDTCRNGETNSSCDTLVPNQAPTANAGPDQTQAVGSTVPLDGTSSSDPDGDALTFQWTLTSKPATSTATLTGATTAVPTFVLDTAGTYQIQLTVSDGNLTSTADIVIVSTTNSAPVADAGADQSGAVNTAIHLDGSQSSDVDGNPLTYQWSFVSRPTTSTATLTNPTTVTPQFTIDKPGTYVVQLLVNDGTVASTPDTVTISTVNSKPVANAGVDQSGTVGTTITLDGSGSSDVDGDALTYQWALTTKPANSTATLSDPTAVTPTFILDKPGTYTAQLIVHDGTIASDPDTITISTLNTKPVADAGDDKHGTVGATVTLNGTLSSDPDGDPITYQWSLTTKPTDSTTSLQNPTTATPSFVLDKPGTYTGQLIVTDGQLDSDPDTVTVTTLNSKPVADAGADQTGQTGTPVQLTGSGSFDVDNNPLTYFWSFTSKPTGSTATLSNDSLANPTFTPDLAGTYVVQLIVNDGTIDSDPDTVTIIVPDTTPPAPADLGKITVGPITNGQVTITGSAGSVEGNAQVTITNPRTNETITVTANADGSFGAQIGVQTGDTLSIIVTDSAGNSSAPGTVTVGPSLPPDPATIAPAINRTVATTVADSTAFLYTGANPIQTGVAAGTIEAKRAALIRGTVRKHDNTPLSGVTIAVLNHPELGQTLSRADGKFDLVVNGGGVLIFTYTKTGYLPAHRHLDVPWQETSTLPDVILLTRDPQVTTIDLTAATPVQVARGSVVTDDDGARQVTLFFPQGTQAQMVLAGGGTQPLTTLHVRSTEYTVGANGPQAMPAPLPPTSAYTYAVDISVDEAVAVGSKQVTFSQPVQIYVENFVGFPVGAAVPVGYYNAELGAWIPENNGRVLKILSITSGLADLDTNGDNITDTAALLSTLGISDVERQQLATLYTPGQSLWRVATMHFSIFDFNWGIGPIGGGPPDAGDPSGPEGGTGGEGSGADPAPEPGAPGGAPDDGVGEPGADTNTGNETPSDGDTSVAIGDSNCHRGSILECENQILGEVLPVAGTEQSLHYSSDRVPGRKSPYVLKIPLTRATLPTGLRRVEVEVRIAGRFYKRSFTPMPSQSTYFTWNGRDVYGRLLQGRQPVTVTTTFVYGAQYMRAAAIARAFAAYGQGPIAVDRAARLDLSEFRFPRTWTGHLGTWQTVDIGLGGWTLTHHHSYDPQGQVLYLGDGSRRVARQLNAEIRTMAGNGGSNGSGTGGPATSASLIDPTSVVMDPAGNLYIAESSGHWVRKVNTNGVLQAFAGTGFGFATTGDGGPAVNARLDSPWGLAIDRDGNVFISDWTQHRVRKVDRNGIITTIAGTGVSGFSGDGGPATSAQLASPRALAIDAQNNLYIADISNQRLRKVSPDGTITTIAGNGVFVGTTTDGVLATQASISVRAIVMDPAGTIYINDTGNRVVWQLRSDGRLYRVAGIPGQTGFSGDGGPARNARLGFNAEGLGLDRHGNLYIADGNENNRIRRVGTDGIINTVVGNGAQGFGGDGGPAPAAPLRFPPGVTIGADGSLYVADSGNRRVRIVSPILPDFTGIGTITIPSADGAELYLFDNRGRHLQTVHALTGAVLYTFSYDSTGRLSQLHDRDGDVTQIERNTNGDPTAIVGPFGQRTTLGLDGNGYVATVTNPAGETTSFGSTAGGLLSSMTTARGQQYTFTYTHMGRLLQDTDPAGGSQTFRRTTIAGGYEVTRTSGLGRVSRYQVTQNSAGTQQRLTINPDGTQVPSSYATNGTRSQTVPNGSVVSRVEGGEARFGLQVPFPKSATVTTPSGLSATTTRTRTATLSTPTNLLSLTNQTDTTTINGRTYTTVYAQTTKTFTTTTPAARQQTTTISAQGRVVQTAAPGLSPITRGYDGHGRLSNLGQGGRNTTVTYDANSYPATVTDSLGRTTSFTRDAVGRPLTQTLPDGRVITYTYDASGNLTSLTPPSRPAHSFTYTPVELPLNYLTPPVTGGGTNATSYTYNVDRELTTITRPDGQQIALTYDPMSRLTSTVLPTGTFSHGYDSAGRVQSQGSLAGANLTYSYDGSLLTTATTTGPVPGSITWTYDNNFRVTAQSVNGSTTVPFTYDTDSLLIGAGALSLARSAQNGLLTGSTLGNVADTYTYNLFAEPTDYQTSVSGTPVFRQQYTRDTGGRVTQKTETINGGTDTYSYTYDTVGRLTEVKQNGLTIATYSYDPNGNRLSKPGTTGTQHGTYDAQDRLLSYNGATYTYTANGELQSKTVGGQTTSYTYDVVGNLLQATLPGGTQIDYVIDGALRRVGKKVNGTLVQGFLYQNQLNPVAELDGSGNLVSRFVYASKGNVPDYLIKGGVTYRLISDHLGSPRLVVDVTTGAIVQRLDYDEFGHVIRDTNPGFQPFGFAGGLYDRDTKLVRFGARDYDAEIGRWATKDPIGFSGGDTNLYGYVLNDPVNFLDPEGFGITVPLPPGTTPQEAAGAANDALLSLCPTPLSVVGKVGVSLAESLAKGLLRPDGKLAPILRAIEEGAAKAAPKSLHEALDLAGRAAQQVGEGLGTIVSQDAGGMVLNNAAGVTTTLKSTGEILIKRGNDILLHILP